jgi:hypothetical protein
MKFAVKDWPLRLRNSSYLRDAGSQFRGKHLGVSGSEVSAGFRHFPSRAQAYFTVMLAVAVWTSAPDFAVIVNVNVP